MSSGEPAHAATAIMALSQHRTEAVAWLQVVGARCGRSGGTYAYALMLQGVPASLDASATIQEQATLVLFEVIATATSPALILDALSGLSCLTCAPAQQFLSMKEKIHRFTELFSGSCTICKENSEQCLCERSRLESVDTIRNTVLRSMGPEIVADLRLMEPCARRAVVQLGVIQASLRLAFMDLSEGGASAADNTGTHDQAKTISKEVLGELRDYSSLGQAAFRLIHLSETLLRLHSQGVLHGFAPMRLSMSHPQFEKRWSRLRSGLMELVPMAANITLRPSLFRAGLVRIVPILVTQYSLPGAQVVADLGAALHHDRMHKKWTLMASLSTARVEADVTELLSELECSVAQSDLDDERGQTYMWLLENGDSSVSSVVVSAWYGGSVPATELISIIDEAFQNTSPNYEHMFRMASLMHLDNIWVSQVAEEIWEGSLAGLADVLGHRGRWFKQIHGKWRRYQVVMRLIRQGLQGTKVDEKDPATLSFEGLPARLQELTLLCSKADMFGPNGRACDLEWCEIIVIIQMCMDPLKAFRQVLCKGVVASLRRISLSGDAIERRAAQLALGCLGDSYPLTFKPTIVSTRNLRADYRGQISRADVEPLFQASLVRHRKSFHSDEFCSAPVLRIVSIREMPSHDQVAAYAGTLQSIAALGPCTNVVSLPMPSLDEANGCNEKLLWHGAPGGSVNAITRDGFDLDCASSLGGAFGRGIYFACHASKADFYAKADELGVRRMILSRVVLGEPFFSMKYMDVDVPPCRKCESVCACNGLAQHSSIYGAPREAGGAVDYPEFVIFTPAQALPLYEVHYEHLDECQCCLCQRND